MIKGLTLNLENALSSRTLIRLERSIEQGRACGYVVGLGTTWFILAVVSDDIWPGGYQALRKKDVTGFEYPAPNTSFMEAALERRSVCKPQPLEIELLTIEALIAYAQKLFPLISIHREVVDPDCCNIGRIETLEKRTVNILEVTCDGNFETKSTRYVLRDITRIDFGGPYEEALASVCLESYRQRPRDQW